MLSRMRSEIVGRISDGPTHYSVARLNTLLIEIDSVMQLQMGDITKSVNSSMNDLVISEAEFTASLLDGAATVNFAVPDSNTLITAAEITAFNVGSEKLTVDQALQQFGRNKRSEITQFITDGVILGDPTDKISRGLRDKMKTLYARQIDALVRTSVNHVASVARDAIYKENEDILEGVEIVATLDSRTTALCGSLDGRVFPIGSGPRPPFHWQCRTTTVPKVKKEFDLGSDITGRRPSKGSSGFKTVNARETYSGWLRRQSKEFQAEALGPARAELFRQQKIDLAGFVDPTGRLYTLNELKITNDLALN